MSRSNNDARKRARVEHRSKINLTIITTSQPPYAPTMSRHKIVKNLDLDDELDDYDGGGDYDDSYGGVEGGGAGGAEGS